jgi:hypothetical protein
MGGSSRSYISEVDDGDDEEYSGNDLYSGYMNYSGNIVSENGGFVSTRTQTFNPRLDLSDFKGIAFNARS